MRNGDANESLNGEIKELLFKLSEIRSGLLNTKYENCAIYVDEISNIISSPSFSYKNDDEDFHLFITEIDKIIDVIYKVKNFDSINEELNNKYKNDFEKNYNDYKSKLGICSFKIGISDRIKDLFLTFLLVFGMYGTSLMSKNISKTYNSINLTYSEEQVLEKTVGDASIHIIKHNNNDKKVIYYGEKNYNGERVKKIYDISKSSEFNEMDDEELLNLNYENFEDSGIPYNSEIILDENINSLIGENSVILINDTYVDYEHSAGTNNFLKNSSNIILVILLFVLIHWIDDIILESGECISLLWENIHDDIASIIFRIKTYAKYINNNKQLKEEYSRKLDELNISKSKEYEIENVIKKCDELIKKISKDYNQINDELIVNSKMNTLCEKEKNIDIERDKRRDKAIDALNEYLSYLNIEEEKNYDDEKLKNIYYHSIKAYDFNILFDFVDDHYEFKKNIVINLRFFDLSNLSYDPRFKLVKMSGIDFRHCNICFDPRKIFKMDISYSIFDDESIFDFVDFENIHIEGADLSFEITGYNFDKAFKDSYTKLPNCIKKTLKC